MLLVSLTLGAIFLYSLSFWFLTINHFMWVMYTCQGAQVEVRGQLAGVSPLLYHVGPKDQTQAAQVTRHGRKCLSHLSGLTFQFSTQTKTSLLQIMVTIHWTPDCARCHNLFSTLKCRQEWHLSTLSEVRACNLPERTQLTASFSNTNIYFRQGLCIISILRILKPSLKIGLREQKRKKKHAEEKKKEMHCYWTS